jgi:hypothetical protein
MKLDGNVMKLLKCHVNTITTPHLHLTMLWPRFHRHYRIIATGHRSLAAQSLSRHRVFHRRSGSAFAIH